ncbi:MAG: type II toxin-antitoxin system Phd/YefM family antitoxin [Myxococcota bacterium]
MRTEKLTDVKNNLSRLVEQVRHGERIRILVRGVPVADLVPIGDEAGREEAPGHLAELERRGVIRRGTGSIADELLQPGPKAGGKPLSQYVVDERESGR